MACNCIRESNAKVLEHVQKTHPDYTITESGYANIALFFGVDAQNKFTSDFTYVYKAPKKDGSLSNPKNGKVSIVFDYCPLCGKAYDEVKEAEPA